MIVSVIYKCESRFTPALGTADTQCQTSKFVLIWIHCRDLESDMIQITADSCDRSLGLSSCAFVDSHQGYIIPWGMFQRTDGCSLVMVSGISFSRIGSSRRLEQPTQPRTCKDQGKDNSFCCQPEYRFVRIGVLNPNRANAFQWQYHSRDKSTIPPFVHLCVVA